MTRGDGTVPSLSARRVGGNDSNLNAQGATIIRCANTPEPIDHTELAKNQSVMDEVLYRLKGTPPNHQGCAIDSEASRIQNSMQRSLIADMPSLATLPPLQPAYYLRLTGALSVTVSDAFGNNTAPISGTFAVTVPGVTDHLLDTTSHLLVLAAGQTYTVTLQSGTDPMVIALTQGTDVTTTMAIRYQDLTLPPNVTALLRFSPQGVENLRYDADGSGAFAMTVTPTVAVSGPAAADTEPPTLAVTHSGPLNAMIVTLSATDGGSGVKAIRYSLDGTTYQPYTGSFQVNARQIPTLYAFADDNVANRSSLLISPLTRTIYVPLVTR